MRSVVEDRVASFLRKAAARLPHSIGSFLKYRWWVGFRLSELPGTQPRDSQFFGDDFGVCSHCSRIFGVTHMSFAPQP
jgi:hypothetical protein